VIRAAALVSIAISLAACGDHGDDKPAHEPVRQRRVIEPPSGIVRPLPPYAIRADGVGPYRLGESLDQLLQLLPSPRIALYDIPGVVHRSIIRAEDDTILVGGEPQQPASFVAVVGSEVARTESGVHVGSSKDELIRALGPAIDDLDRARDPRLIALSGLRNLRAIVDGDRVAALVVVGPPPPLGTPSPPATAPSGPSAPIGPHDAGAPPAPPPVNDTCPRPVPTGEAETGLQRFGACLTPSGELIDVAGDDLSVRGPDADHALASVRVPGLVFAAPLRVETGRDELVAITRADDPATAARTWSLTAFRLDGNHLVRVSYEPSQLYQLSAANARWVGAELHGLDLYLEVASRPDAVEVSGLLAIHVAGTLRDVVAISPVVAVPHHGKPATDLVDAGIGSAADAIDAGSLEKH
jgi:hypothetical protein